MNEDYLISRKRIFSATLFVVIAILLSKLSGLARDQIMAGFFGLNYDVDAFTWAYFIPNLFRILFAESLIVAAFIPIYSLYLKKKNYEDAKIFVSSMTNIMLILFVVIAALIFILSPQIGRLLSGISGNNMDITKFVVMNRIMIFSLVLLSLSGLATGILNSHNIFTVPSLAPFMLNIVTIICVVFLFRDMGIYSMALGVMIGSVLHLLIQFPQLKASKLVYRPAIDFKHKGIKEIFSLMFPILLSLGAVQLNNSIDNFFALNLGAGNTTALTLSWRVANLPLGVFSVAVVTVLYPLLSRQAAENNMEGIKESFSLGIREIGYVMVPASCGLVILSYPVIKVLFEHYNFVSQDTARVSFILIFHSLGLVFFGLLMILNRIFYSFKNVKTPLKVAGVSILINLLLDWILVKFMGAGGLALSTTLVAIFNVTVLLIILRKNIGELGAARIIRSYYKILASSAIMSGAVYIIWRYTSPYAYRNIFWLIGILAGIIILGSGVYAGITVLLRMDEVRFVINILGGRRSRPPGDGR
jgi:putative peptidoglycan lipid II flippase